MSRESDRRAAYGFPLAVATDKICICPKRARYLSDPNLLDLTETDRMCPDTDPKPFNELTPDEATKLVIEEITSTPEGRAAVERLGSKDQELTQFQQKNGISEQISEAAIKEWVLTHNGNFDWALEDVKAICLRNKTSGIPSDYLP